MDSSLINSLLAEGKPISHLLPDPDKEGQVATELILAQFDPAILAAVVMGLQTELKAAKEDSKNHAEMFSELMNRVVKLAEDLAHEHQQMSFWSSEIRDMLLRLSDYEHKTEWGFVGMRLGCKCKGCKIRKGPFGYGKPPDKRQPI